MRTIALTLFEGIVQADIGFMGACRHGQGGGDPETLAPPLWECCKVFFVLQMFSKVLVGEVFMHF